MAKKGTQFQSEISKSLDLIPRSWKYKFVDHPGASFSKDHVARFSLPLPGDFVGCISGKMFLLELKQTSKIQAIPFAILSDNQYRHLRDVYEAGGLSYILINFRDGDINETIVLDFERFDYLKKNTDRKSMTLEVLKNEKHIERIKLTNGYGWNLTSLFMEVIDG